MARCEFYGTEYLCDSLLAYEEAARLYQMALDALGVKASTDESARCELLLGLGDVEARGGDTARGKRRSPRRLTLRASWMRRSSSHVPPSGTAGDSCGSAAGSDRRRERARGLIREAVNGYRELGMQNWADEASELEQAL